MSQLASPLPGIITGTIGKLKACGATWDILYKTVVIPVATFTEIVASNPARVLLVVTFPTVGMLLYPGNMAQNGSAIQITASFPYFLGSYDTHGPLISEKWTVWDGFGGNANIVEIVANS